jgi:hypothetical protein
LRDLVLSVTALLFLLAALYTVTVRRELYAEGRRNALLEERLREQRRQNDNLRIDRERLAAPGAVLERARLAGLVDEGGAGGR